MKLAWNVPRATRTYFVDHLLSGGLSSTRVDIMVRYLKFFRGLLKRPTREVLSMSNIAAMYVRSTVGKNLNFFQTESGKDLWTITQVTLGLLLPARRQNCHKKTTGDYSTLQDYLKRGASFTMTARKQKDSPH